MAWIVVVPPSPRHLHERYRVRRHEVVAAWRDQHPTSEYGTR
jgi:hypothetical protein